MFLIFVDGSKNGFSSGAVDQMVEEFMCETQMAATVIQQPFRMDALLQVGIQ